MSKTTSMARCKIRGHQFEVRRLPGVCGTYDIGMDGWLIANTCTAHNVISIIREELRMAGTLHVAPSVPKRFAEAVESL